MIRSLARWYARRKYRWATELEAGVADLQAALSAQRAGQKRDMAAQLRKEAEGMEAHVASMTEMEEKGFWLCDNGHEKADAFLRTSLKPDFKECDDCAKNPGSPVLCDDCLKRRAGRTCLDCKAPTKFIKRDLMTGQEKYESDKQRKEVETMIAEKKKLADQYDTDAKGGEDTAKHFTRQAASSREVADRLQKL